MSIFRCPLCKAKLEKQERSLRCEHGHSFDISAEGYVHLLPANKMNSKIPGDSKEMAASRSAFLDKGYYEPLLLELEKTVLELSKSEKVSDSGHTQKENADRKSQASTISNLHRHFTG